MALKGEKELICKVIMVGRQLELISKLKCLKFVLDESVTDGLECCRKITSGKKVVNAIRSLVSDRILQLQYAWVLDKNLFMPVQKLNNSMEREEKPQNYGCIYRKSKGFIGYKQNRCNGSSYVTRRREVDKVVDESVLQWSGHIERMRLQEEY